MHNKINICLACDDNYSKYAGVVIASILYNANSSDELCIYVLDGGVSDKHKEEILSLKSIKNSEISFVDIDQSLFTEYSKIKTHSYVTIATYYRLKLPSLLPNIDRIIYFDCDMVINSSLKELFNTEMGECLVAGAKDINKRMLKKNPTYVNAGMLVFDLKNMRKDNTEEKFLSWTIQNTESIKVGDQTIINEVCKNRIKIVQDKWNVQSSNFTNRSSYTNKPSVVHFVAKKKPWHWASFSYHRDLYFKYLQLTPWKLSDWDYENWTKNNQLASLKAYFKYRPLFLLRPRFYIALYHTYLKAFLSKILSFSELNETHNVLCIFNLRIKLAKREFVKKKKQNPYYYYKKNNVDITTLPPAVGQIRDIQLGNLVLLKEFAYVCERAGLKYWLDAGTLIGAIRHKGFIPWDDDIDVGMIREDYNKIIDAFNKYSSNKDIYADYYRDTARPSMYFIKVQHKKCKYLFVDIFPFDIYGRALNSEEQIITTEKIKQIRQKIELEEKELSDIELKEKTEFLMKNEILVNEIPKNLEDSDIIWGIDFRHSWKNWFTNYNVIYPLQKVEFEGAEFYTMNNPDAFLKRLYGNYMAYPKKIGLGHSGHKNLTEEDKNIIKNLIEGLQLYAK